MPAREIAENWHVPVKYLEHILRTLRDESAWQTIRTQHDMQPVAVLLMHDAVLAPPPLDVPMYACEADVMARGITSPLPRLTYDQIVDLIFDIVGQRLDAGHVGDVERDQQREAAIEGREASLEADQEIREDKLERREAELAALQERLGQKETELATYVAQVQTQLKQREDEWWQKVTGGDPDAVAAE